MKINFKNYSNKTVDAVRYVFSLFNNFNENVTLSGTGNIADTWQQPIKPKKKSEMILSVRASENTSKVKNTFVDQVHFTDGTMWEAGDSATCDHSIPLGPDQEKR